MEDFQRIRSEVDRLLLEQGIYSPVELLLAEGRLSYPDYEAWRHGRVIALEEVLAGNPARIRALLDEAGRYAVKLGLHADRREFFSWEEEAGQTLRFSSDVEFEELCCVHYRRVGNEVQLDLFMDNSGNVLVNGIADALASRRVEEAIRLTDRLLETDPSHPRLGMLEVLCNATQRQFAPVDDCFSEIEYLEGYLVPMATEALGVGARDFLVPFWRRMADALRGRPFVADTPLLHASYPLGRAHDWAGVKESVLEDSGGQIDPVLRLRLAEALFYLGNRPAALAAWCRMCWDFPVRMEQALASGALPDKELQPDWERYRDLEVEPELSTLFFPVWLLLERTETCNALTAKEVSQAHAAGRAYAALHELLADGGALSERTMALRQKLKQAHPGLFAMYMRRICHCS